MKYLFLHQNFPGQFAHLAPALAAAGHEVTALTSRVEQAQGWHGVTILPYAYEAPRDHKLHPWMTMMDGAVDRGAATYRAALALRQKGYTPDVVVAHSGWGEALFIRDVWPEAKLGIFCEFFYQAEGADVDFDPEFRNEGEIGRQARMRMRNLAMRMQLDAADAGISPTRWQADAHPPELRRKIDVVFDGIDTGTIRPDAEAVLSLEGIGRWSRDDEVITFVNRNLEPYRGFHVFMRALPDLLRRRPNAQVIVVGEDGVSYGSKPRQGGTWKEAMLAEIGPHLSAGDRARLHFTGRLGRADFTRLLQVSRVHVYLTYPFVLSWSLMEAMAAGGAIAASGTAPVREVLDHDRTALLFDFFDGDALVGAVERLCEDAALRERLGAAARAGVVAEYDLHRVCLPAQLGWLGRLTGSDTP